MKNSCSGNFAPDYNMRRRNQSCGNARGPGQPVPDPCERIPLSAMPLAMAYVPTQIWQNLYELDRALAVGTIFEDLDYPWEVGRCRCL